MPEDVSIFFMGNIYYSRASAAWILALRTVNAKSLGRNLVSCREINKDTAAFCSPSMAWKVNDLVGNYNMGMHVIGGENTVWIPPRQSNLVIDFSIHLLYT